MEHALTIAQLVLALSVAECLVFGVRSGTWTCCQQQQQRNPDAHYLLIRLRYSAQAGNINQNHFPMRTMYLCHSHLEPSIGLHMDMALLLLRLAKHYLIGPCQNWAKDLWRIYSNESSRLQVPDDLLPVWMNSLRTGNWCVAVSLRKNRFSELLVQTSSWLTHQFNVFSSGVQCIDLINYNLKVKEKQNYH